MTTSSIGPGTLLGGRYQLQELLSDHEGARFWRATDTVLVRNVAVHAVPSDEPRAGELLAGARLSATVADPHLLRVLDCDGDPSSGEGITWVVNEWGAGISLDLMLQRGPLAPPRAAWLVGEVAECIAAAHAQGVPHGCLNPEAVLVTEAGAVKLIGFVVAAVLEGRPAPDACYGALDDREADVVNLAGLLYAALTGRWPGVARSAVPAAPREGGRPLRPRRVRAGVPRTLDAICTRVLLREGNHHDLPVETAYEVAAALSDYAGGPATTAPMDLPGLHAEPTISLPRAPLDGWPHVADGTSPSNGTPLTTGPPPSNGTSPPVNDTDPGTAAAVPEDPERTQLHDLLATDTADATAGRVESPAPPPPFEEIPERPLFASAEPRRNLPADWPPGPDPDGSPRPLTSSGSGTLPPASNRYWPFTSAEDPANAPSEQFTGKEGRNWLRLAAVVGVCLAVVVAMAFAFRLGRDNGRPSAHPSGGSSAAETAVSSHLKVVSATAFDPEGDHVENDAETPNAIDGRPGTTWRTSTYYDNPRLGGLKSGVGLLLDLGADRQVGSLRVHFVGSPTSVVVYAAPAGVSDPPTTLTGMHRVGGNASAGTNAVLRLDSGTHTRYLVVWLTRLPAVQGGYRGEISDISAWS